MANNEEELKKEVARLHQQYEAEIPRLTDLSVAVISALESNDASPPEVSAVCLDLMLQAIRWRSESTGRGLGAAGHLRAFQGRVVRGGTRLWQPLDSMAGRHNRSREGAEGH